MNSFGPDRKNPPDAAALNADQRTHAKGPSEESERWLRAAVQNSSDIVMILETDSTIRYVSPAVKRVLGYRSEDLVGTIALDYVHPEDLEYMSKSFAESVEKPGVQPPIEYRVRAADGSWRHMEAIRSNWLDDPNVAGLVSNVRDVTERKKAEEDLRKTQEFMAGILDNAPFPIYIVSEEGRMRLANRFFADFVGMPQKEVIGSSLEEVFTEEEARQFREINKKVIETKTPVIEEEWTENPDGRRNWQTIKFPLRDSDSGADAIGGISIDFTDRKRAEEALRESEERFRTTFENAPVGVALVGLDGRRFRANRSLCEMLDCSEEDLLGENYLEHVHPDDRQISTEHFQRALEEGAGSYALERRYLRADGHVVWNLTSVSLIRDSEGNPSYFVCLHQDITERKEAEKRLRYQATHDELTDLPNRHLFMDRLKRALRFTRRRRGRKVAVLYLDLDNFKVVNDSLGHDAGDLLLVAVGERVRWCLRPEDTLARFGGDEFAVLLEEVEAPSDAAKVADRIVERFRAPLVVEEREFVIRPSIGIALGTVRQNTAEDLLRDADTAMYQAKGRDDDYRVFDPNMYEQALRRLKLESDLRRAIEDEEFVVCYQPIVNLQTGEASGVEVLVRWQHPDQQGLLAPSQFISVAEESGLVVPMGRWVLEEACRQGAKWQQEHPLIPPLVIAVNLSAKQLQHPDVAETVEEILEKTGFEARGLSLDITETVYIEVLEGNTAALDKIKRLGVCISIDDFGTGYSSLAYLKRLPVDTLKIDKSFIKGIGEDIEDTAIVQMIIELAHTLGMEIIAEGVESEGQAEQLKEMGCDRGQGFYFAKPLPPEAVPDFLIR